MHKYQPETKLPTTNWKCVKCGEIHEGNEGCPECRNSGFGTMNPAQRFNSLARMATEFFDTDRWKTAFCKRYDLTPQTLTVWKNKGAPVWAAQAMADALKAQRLANAVELIKSVSIEV